MNNMSLELPGQIPLELPKDSTLESLYQINNKSIWFLIWIFKKEKFWMDLTREVLETPFSVERYYWSNGQIFSLMTHKNNKYHGIDRGWYENGQLWLVRHWKDGRKNGISRSWYESGQLWSEHHWKDGKKDGIHRGWDEIGQLRWETHWKDGHHIYEKII